MNYRYLSRWKFDKCRMEKRRSCQPKLTTRRPHSQPWSVCHILLFIYPFGFNELSYGYSSVIQIMLCMEHNLKGIVLIDELETHLHIELQSWLSFSHKFNLLIRLILLLRLILTLLFSLTYFLLPRKRRESPLNVCMKRRKNNLHYLSL